jgi:hypothetical protein
MQTRKRAKSVMFGNKITDKEKKEPAKHHIVEKEVIKESEKTAAKASVVERRAVPEKPHIDEELSSDLPKTDEESQTVEESQSSDVPEDSPISAEPEPPKDIKEASSENANDTIAQPKSEDHVLSQPIEKPEQPAVTPDQSLSQGGSQDLSSTLPPSAFSIQTDDQTPAVNNTGTPGKKRFVIYFFVVAFISFILGLAAMAGASYFGLTNLHLNKLTSNVHIPNMLGQKPTPTVIPPTVAPTQKPVNLTAYTIAVLNGSGIAGKAASEKSALTSAGFSVTSVGNATNSNYTKTEISAKSSVDQAFLTKLESELQNDYDVNTSIATSPSSSQTDVTVTLGTSTAQQ